MGLFGKKKDTIKNVVVKPSTEYVIWNIDISNIERETILDVETGCSAIYLVNGNIKANNMPGRWVIKSKDEDKRGDNLKLIGVNTDKTFDILCGVGGVPYKDYETDVETNVGARGEAKVKIAQPYKVYSTLCKDNITPQDMDEYIRNKLSEIMSTTLAQLIQKYDYQTVNTQLSVMSEHIFDLFSEECLKVGLQCDSFTINTIFFPDEFIERRKDYFDEKIRKKEEKQARREKEREVRLDNETMMAQAEAQAIVNKSLNETKQVSESKTVTVIDSNAPINNNTTVVRSTALICPNCKAPVKGDSNFCSKCGTRVR